MVWPEAPAACDLAAVAQPCVDGGSDARRNRAHPLLVVLLLWLCHAWTVAKEWVTQGAARRTRCCCCGSAMHGRWQRWGRRMVQPGATAACVVVVVAESCVDGGRGGGDARCSRARPLPVVLLLGPSHAWTVAKVGATHGAAGCIRCLWCCCCGPAMRGRWLRRR